MVDFQVKRLSKMAELEEPDRISQLPETVLSHILSFLSMDEAARTSILARSWKWLWLFSDAFNFDSSRLITPQDLEYPARTALDVPLLRGRFFEGVNEVLRSHRLHMEKASKIGRLRLHFPLPLDSWYAKRADKCVSYAFERRVHSLELDFSLFHNPRNFYSNKYSFPDSLASETDLSCLGSLSLSGVDVSKENIDSFLFKFPFLEHLKVHNSGHPLLFVEIGSSSRALKYLEITHCKGISVIVRDSGLVSLTLTHVEKLVLENNPQLLSVSAFEEAQLQVLSSCCLSGLQNFTWNLNYDNDGDGVLGLVPQLSELKQLTLIVAPEKREALIRLTKLISLSPKLEKLVLEFVSWSKKKSAPYKRSRRFSHDHLKMVEVRNYFGTVTEDKLLRDTLKHVSAPIERVIFDPYSCSLSRDYREAPVISVESRAELLRGVVAETNIRRIQHGKKRAMSSSSIEFVVL